jgi:hypothetical protein
MSLNIVPGTVKHFRLDAGARRTFLRRLQQGLGMMNAEEKKTEGTTSNERKKCAHLPCQCLVKSGDRYCGQAFPERDLRKWRLPATADMPVARPEGKSSANGFHQAPAERCLFAFVLAVLAESSSIVGTESGAMSLRSGGWAPPRSASVSISIARSVLGRI